MRVFITGASGHHGSLLVPELIAAGHQVTALARSDASAAAVAALGAEVRRGDLADLNGLREAAVESDGVIHVAVDRDRLQSGEVGAVVDADLGAVHTFAEALTGTDKPLVAASSLGAPGSLGRPLTEEDPALPGGPEHKGTLRARNEVEIFVVGLAEQGVRSSAVRLPPVSHSTQDRSGFLVQLIALAKQKGVSGYPGDGTNLWPAVHALDVASLFRLALENGPAGGRWHGVGDEGIPFREIAQGIGDRLGLPTRSVPADQVPAHFGFLAYPTRLNIPTSNLITRQTLGWEPVHPGLLADLGNGHYFTTPVS